MPYTIAERDNEFCVFLKDSDGNPTSDTLGCHPTHDEAQKQIAAIEASEQRSVFVVRAVNEPEGIIEGALMLWGAPDMRDEYQTWADPKNPPQLGLDTLPIRLMYEHGCDPEVRRDVIGKVTKVWTDDDGFKFSAALNRAGKWFKRIINEIKDGALKTSSASSEHLSSFDDWGRFADWLLTELSLTKDPAEPRMPTVAIVRSKIENTTGVSRGAREAHEVERRADNVIDEQEQKDNTMSEPMDLGAALAALIEEFGAEAVQAALAELEGRSGEGETPVPPTIDEMRSLLAEKSKEAAAANLATRIAALETANTQRGIEQQGEQPPAEPLPSAAGSTLSFDRMSTWRMGRFAGRSGREFATASVLMRAAGKPTSLEFKQAMADQVFKEAEAGNAPAQASIRAINKYAGGNVTRADVMGEGVTGFGAEWVGTMYEDGIWEKVRSAPIYGELKKKGLRETIVPRGYKSNQIEIEGADPSWFMVPETSLVTATGQPKVELPVSKVGTANTTITTKKLGAAVLISGELVEDSIIDVAAQVNRQVIASAEEQIISQFINSDTETAANTNINLIDGTPPANAPYLAMDGVLKTALVTAGAGGYTNKRDDGTVFDTDTYRFLLSMLGDDGEASNDLDLLAFIINAKTRNATLGLADLKTSDVAGSNATLQNGKVVNMWGVDVLVSGQLALRDSAGKISATTANNTRGIVALVRPDRFHVGFKRQVNVKTEESALADTLTIVTYFRMGMVYRVVNEGVAVSYNVNVTG